LPLLEGRHSTGRKDVRERTAGRRHTTILNAASIGR
jgi:hypothetical protein